MAEPSTKGNIHTKFRNLFSAKITEVNLSAFVYSCFVKISLHSSRTLPRDSRTNLKVYSLHLCTDLFI